MWSGRSSTNAFAAICREMCDQDIRFGSQNWPDGTGICPADNKTADRVRRECDLLLRSGQGSWRALVAEEVAEAFAESDPDRLMLELIQVGGLVMQWVEALLLRRAGLLPPPPVGHRDANLLSAVQTILEDSC